MAKNYILEPVECEFSESSEGLGYETAITSQVLTYEQLTAFDSSYILEVSDGTVLKYAVQSDSGVVDSIDVCFTPDGTMSEALPEAFAVVRNRNELDLLDDHVEAATVIFYSSPGTYTVSIYTETDSGNGLPDMNITLNYENPANNGIALVTKAFLYGSIRDYNNMTDEEKSTFNDILYNPGYAPMERLVRAAALSFGVGDPYNISSEDKELYALDFANDWERLAFAINSDMFLKDESLSNIEQPQQPAEPIGGMV